jgi:hypothetical protein
MSASSIPTMPTIVVGIIDVALLTSAMHVTTVLLLVQSHLAHQWLD